jgi:hypothetical protein
MNSIVTRFVAFYFPKNGEAKFRCPLLKLPSLTESVYEKLPSLCFLFLVQTLSLSEV